MKKLTKPFIVVYKDHLITIASSNNSETIVPEILDSAEFDTQIELDNFVASNNLKYEHTIKN